MDPPDAPSTTIFRGWPGSGAYVWSPFVIKLELRLRLAGIKYATDGGSLKDAPKGKFPYVTIARPNAEGGAVSLADSTLIIRKLTEDGTLGDVNAHLSPEEGAQDLALRALFEDKLYFYHMYERWHINYYAMRSHVLASLPYPAQVVVGLVIYRRAIYNLYGQGTGRFSYDEIAEFRAEIWESVDALLRASRSKSAAKKADEPFWILGGEEPTEADTVVFAFIVSVLICSAAPDSNKVVRSFPALVDYASRIHNLYFPDYEHWD